MSSLICRVHLVGMVDLLVYSGSISLSSNENIFSGELCVRCTRGFVLLLHWWKRRIVGAARHSLILSVTRRFDSPCTKMALVVVARLWIVARLRNLESFF